MLYFFWKPHGDQNWEPFDEICDMQVAKRVTEEDFTNVSTELYMQHTLVIGWSEIKTLYLQGFELSISTNQGMQLGDASGGWFLSGHVWLLQSQYESKSARTALKIISQKSGGLFLVNIRPFPEHSSKIATFSAGRAWLEASVVVHMKSHQVRPYKIWITQTPKNEKKHDNRQEECWGSLPANPCCWCLVCRSWWTLTIST